jgi:hypothetical protein
MKLVLKKVYKYIRLLNENGIQIGYYIGYLQMIQRWINSLELDNESHDKKQKLLIK